MFQPFRVLQFEVRVVPLAKVLTRAQSPTRFAFAPHAQGWASLLHTFLEAACSCIESIFAVSAVHRLAGAAPRDAPLHVVVTVTFRPGRRAYGADVRVFVYTAYSLPLFREFECAWLEWRWRQKHQAKLDFNPLQRVLARRRPLYSYRGYGGRRSSSCFPAQRSFIPPGSVPKARLFTANTLNTSCPSSLTHPHPIALLRQNLPSPRLSILDPQRTATSRIPSPQPLTVARCL
jgi:hypothetical protein